MQMQHLPMQKQHSIQPFCFSSPLGGQYKTPGLIENFVKFWIGLKKVMSICDCKTKLSKITEKKIYKAYNFT
jgi:hypothetical protein